MMLSGTGRTIALCICALFLTVLSCDTLTISLSFVIPKKAEATDTQTIALPAGARVVVNNDNGSTRVEVSPTAAQATIEITRIALGSDQAEADDLLAQIVVTITEPTPGDNTLRIDAPKPDAATGSESDFEFTLIDDELNITGILNARLVAVVKIRITLPQGHGVDIAQKNGAVRASDLDTNSTLGTQNGSIRVLDATAGVTVRTENGSVDVQDHRGSLDARTENGSIEIEVRTLDAAEQILARSDNGRLALDLPRDIDAQLRAETNHGLVSFDITDFDNISNATATFQSVVATLNAGGPTINLRTENGGIDIDGF